MQQAIPNDEIEFHMPAAQPVGHQEIAVMGRQSVAPMAMPAAPANAGAIDLMEMIKIAVQAGNLDLVREMRSIQKEWEADQARKAFITAFADAKAQIKPIARNRRVSFEAKNGGSDVDYRHEDIAAIAEAVDEILANHGLSYNWKCDNEFESGKVSVTCVMRHRLGYEEHTHLNGKADIGAGKNALQAIASATQYLSRYTLKLALGLAVKHDDDGRASGEPVDDRPSNRHDPGETITLAQADQIIDLLEAKGMTTKRMLKWVQHKSPGVELIADIPAARFNECITTINNAA
ncbi:MAG: hypothetical protein GC182_09105 [Rhodopseudomonas sp.]|nr:hypothetical protein [Rhodopseudomonas sp.]